VQCVALCDFALYSCQRIPHLNVFCVNRCDALLEQYFKEDVLFPASQATSLEQVLCAGLTPVAPDMTETHS
jgi:hypothetical protein